MELKLIILKRKRAEAIRNCEEDLGVKYLFHNSDSEHSDDCIPIATYKKLPVKKGPTSRSRGSKASTVVPDYFSSSDLNFGEV